MIQSRCANVVQSGCSNTMHVGWFTPNGDFSHVALFTDREVRKSDIDKIIGDRKMNRKKVARSVLKSGAEHQATMKESDLRTGRTTVL